ncbi:restriction endonuclease subunit S [Lutibacter sp.]|uniref:restriction endonuclease subunit S n=1 Tax=Lutibacter sp. TaxID=1925666 RepID=UPI003562495B
MSYIQLGDICDVVKGEIGIAKAIPGDYPLVTTGEDRKSHNKFQLDTPAVLIPLVSATGHGHASINRIHYQEGKFAFGSILAACVPKNKKYSAKFLHIYFNLMKDYVLVPLMKGSANVSLTLGNLKTAKVPDISLELQLKIVDLYYNIKIELDRAKDLLNDQKNDIAKLRQSILQEAVQGKLTADWRSRHPELISGSHHASQLLKRIQQEKAQLIKDKKIKKEKPLPQITKDEIPYELPEGWVWCRIGDLTTIKGGKRIPKGYQLSDVESAHVYIRVTDLKKGTVISTKLKYITEDVFEMIKAYTISKDDLYITIAGTIGDVGVIPEELDNMNLTENAAKLIIYQVDKIYLKTLLSSHICQSQFLEKINKMAQPKLALHRISSTIIPMPSLHEQKAIVQKVNTLMGLCDALEQQVQQSQEQSEQLMQSCLREVFEGKNKIN